MIDTDLSQSEELFMKTEGIRGAYKPILGVHLLSCAQNGNGTKSHKAWCPINKLRICICIVLDIDCVSSSNTLTIANRNKDVLCVYDISDCLTNNETELIEEYKNKAVISSQMVKLKSDYYSTNYSQCINKEIPNADCDTYTAQYYQPCIIARNTKLPRYGERFNVYGFNNEIVHIERLAVADRYNFSVLNSESAVSPLCAKSKDFILKLTQKKHKDMKTAKQVMGGCLHAFVCVLR